MEQTLRQKLYGNDVTLGEKIQQLKDEEMAKNGTVQTPKVKVVNEPGADELRGAPPITG